MTTKVFFSRPQALVWVAALVLLSAYVTAFSARRTTHGFIAYYTAARLLVSGQLGPQIYDDVWFMSYVQKVAGTDVREIFGPNTPAMSVLALPVVVFTPATARFVWLIASLAALAVASAALLWGGGRRAGSVPAALAALLLFNPSVFANLRSGQAYLFVFAAFAACALCFVRGRDEWAGAWLGLLIVLKSTGFPLLALFAVARRWRGAAVAVLVAAAVLLATLVWTGFAVWQRYPAYVLEFLARPSTSVTAYQTTAGAIRHLCVGDPVWNPSPAADCPGVAAVFPFAALVAALAMTLVLARNAPVELWLAAGVCLSVLAAPIAEDHHFVSLGVAMVLLLQGQPAPGEPSSVRRWWPWAVYAVLLMLPLGLTAERWTRGWTALLAYPRLYAGWWLWALVVSSMRWNAKIGRSAVQ